MKLKNLKKKIRRIEARMEEDPQKLSKLKRRLDAITATKARKAQKKAATRAAARLTIKSSMLTQKKKRRLTANLQVKPTSARGRTAARTVKRKLNLSPERRAQLAAAMKARWAARRAAADAHTENTSAGRDFMLGQVPQAP